MESQNRETLNKHHLFRKKLMAQLKIRKTEQGIQMVRKLIRLKAKFKEICALHALELTVTMVIICVQLFIW